MTGQLRFDSRGVTNTLDSKSSSSGRGNKGVHVGQMICVVSRLDATAEYEPFCFVSQQCLDVCLDPIIKVLSQLTHLSQTHSHVHVGCTQNTIPQKV